MDNQYQPPTLAGSSTPSPSWQPPRKPRTWVIGVLATVVVMCIAGIMYVAFAKQPDSKSSDKANATTSQSISSQDLYRQAIENAVSMPADDIYVSFDVVSENSRFKGQLISNLKSGDGTVRADYEMNGESDGVSLKMSGEIINVEKDKITQGYAKYGAVTSSDAQYGTAIESYFAPVLNKWVKLPEEKREDEPTSFDREGSMAAFNGVAALAPYNSYSEADKQVFLSALDTHDLYEIDELIKQTKYRGADVREVHVTVNKDAFTAFDKELAAKLSPEADHKGFESAFLDQLFGKENTLEGLVYLHPSEPKIIGADFEVDLDEPVEDGSLGVVVDKVHVSFLLESSQKFKIDIPTDTMTEAQLERLLRN